MYVHVSYTVLQILWQTDQSTRQFLELDIKCLAQAWLGFPSRLVAAAAAACCLLLNTHSLTAPYLTYYIIHLPTALFFLLLFKQFLVVFSWPNVNFGIIKLATYFCSGIYIWSRLQKSYTGCFFSLGLPLKIESIENLDTPHIGFPYFPIFGGGPVKKHPV